MKRTAGYVLFYVGLLLVLAAWVLLSPTRIGVNGHWVDAHVALSIVGFAIAVLGVVLVARTKTK